MTATPARNDLVRLHLNPGTAGDLAMTDDCTSITFDRGNEVGQPADVISPGSLSIALSGDTYSPATNPDVRPDRPIVLYGRDHTGTLRSLWTGRLAIPTITYSKSRRDKLNQRATVVLPATDVVQRLSEAIPSVDVWNTGTLQDLVMDATYQHLGGYGFGIDIEGGPPTGTGAMLGGAGGRKSLERLQIIVDTFGGSWLYSSRDALDTIKGRHYGALGAPSTTPLFTFSAIPTDVDDTVSETVDHDVAAPDGTYLHYTDISIGHDVEQFVNALTIETLFPRDGVPAGTHGPYLDGYGIYEWGRRPGSITVIRPGSTGLERDAEVALGRRAEPDVCVKTITVDVLNNRRVLAQDLLYKPVRIKHAATGHNALYRVLRESHTIGPTTWSATYTVRPIEPWRPITITTDA